MSNLDICLQHSLYLQRPFQLCKGPFPLRLGGASCSWEDPWGAHWLGLFRWGGVAPRQRIAQEASIKQQLQHALLRDSPIQRAAELQCFPAMLTLPETPALWHFICFTMASCQ